MAEFIERYRNMSDEDLIETAVKQARNLLQEPADDLLQVLVERKVDRRIIEHVHNQRKVFRYDEICDMAYQYTQGICPVCKNERVINGMMFKKVTGAVIITHTETKLLIGCDECIKKEFNETLSLNLCLGWWSLHGFIETPIALISMFIRHHKLKNNFCTLSKDYEHFLRQNAADILFHIEQRSLGTVK